MLRRALSSPHLGRIEVAGLALLYGVYEIVRGLTDLDFAAARANTDRIVALEQRFHLFVERDIQEWVLRVPGLSALLGVSYLALHIGVTIGALVWVYRARRPSFPLVRTVLVFSTALALVGYVAFPVAPPRLAGLGFVDTVSENGGVDLSSDLLGSLYNPLAAVPSLHFGYALLVGVALARLAGSPVVRVLGATYPLVMLLVIVATGNHFFVDAVAGGLVVALAWLVAAATIAVPARRPNLKLESSMRVRGDGSRPVTE